MKKILAVSTLVLISVMPLSAVCYTGKFLVNARQEWLRQRAALAEIHPETPRRYQQIQPFLRELTPEQQHLQQQYGQSLSQEQIQQIMTIVSRNPVEQVTSLLLELLSPAQQELLNQFIQSLSPQQAQLGDQIGQSMSQNNH